MQQFAIVTLTEQKYDVVVFSKSYESPFSCMDMLAKEIQKDNIQEARILFDTLLSTGNTSERFAEAYYKNDGFVMDSFQYVKITKADSLRKYCAQFFYENREILESSILTPVQKRLLEKGIVI